MVHKKLINNDIQKINKWEQYYDWNSHASCRLLEKAELFGHIVDMSKRYIIIPKNCNSFGDK